MRDGEVLGTQSLMANDFPVTRTAETGSWLGLRHHGQGVGTRMRLMILHLLFEGFDGLRATTSAFDDNAASNAVTRRIGYAENGVEVLAREGKPATSRRYVLDRADVGRPTGRAAPGGRRSSGSRRVREQLGI